MIKIKKANGLNKYKIVQRFLFIFWVETDGLIYTGKAVAQYNALFMANQLGLEFKL